MTTGVAEMLTGEQNPTLDSLRKAQVALQQRQAGSDPLEGQAEYAGMTQDEQDAAILNFK